MISKTANISVLGSHSLIGLLWDALKAADANWDYVGDITFKLVRTPRATDDDFKRLHDNIRQLEEFVQKEQLKIKCRVEISIDPV